VAELALIVMPTRLDGNVEGPLQFYLLRNGVWRDVPPSAKVSTPATVRDSIQTVLSNIIASAGGANAKSLYSWFKDLSQAFLPERVRHELNALPQSDNEPSRLLFYLHPTLEWIPWELLHDGEGYLGLRYAVARIPLVLQGPMMTNGPVRSVRRVASFLGNNVLDDQLQATWRETFSGLPAPVTVEEFPASDGDWPTADTLADVVGSDILHITCHGGIKDEIFGTGDMWTLDHQGQPDFNYSVNVTLVRQMSSVSKTEPLVFGNACASVGNAGDAGGLVPGLASAFFDAGAAAFVGAFAPVRGPIAVRFAKTFYGHLLSDGLPVGVAVWRTKKDFQEQGEQDPSWLFYCLYGSPDTKFVAQ
jgi:CHAT domain-containing protein